MVSTCKHSFIHVLKLTGCKGGMIWALDSYVAVQLPAREQPKGEKPADSKIGVFVVCAEFVSQLKGKRGFNHLFMNGFQDHDLEDFRRGVDKYYASLFESHVPPVPLHLRVPFDKELVDKILYYLDREGS